MVELYSGNGSKQGDSKILHKIIIWPGCCE
jgi:hypothetical protein